MNRWLYRAAGTVGVAGGFLLLGTGGAHATPAVDQVPGPQDVSGEARSSIGDLPPLNLAAKPTTGQPELLPGLPDLSALLPTSLLGSGSDQSATDPPGLGLPLDTLPVGTLPLDALPVSSLPLTGQQPAHLLRIDGQPVTLPVSVGEQLPVPLPASVGDQLPALIADQLMAEGDWSPDLFAEQADLTGGLPAVGDVLQPIAGLVNLGNLPAQLPLVGPLAGPALGQLPFVEAPPGAAAGPATAPADSINGRPIVGDDPEYSR